MTDFYFLGTVKSVVSSSIIYYSPVTSTKVGISHQSILTFSFNPFVTLV